MNGPDIDKLFVAWWESTPYCKIAEPVLTVVTSYVNEGFRAAMKSEHVKGLERDAERYRHGVKQGYTFGKHPYQDQYDVHWLYEPEIDAAIRQRADQIERKGETK